MDDPATTPPASGGQKPGCWFLFFGIVELLIGAAAALIDVVIMAIFLFAEKLPAGRGELHPRVMAIVACFYGALAFLFIAAGIGTLRRRRWARTLMLLVSAFWLGVGILLLFFMVAMWPVLAKGISQGSAGASPAALAVALGSIAAILLLLYAILPGSLLLFYTRKTVREAFSRGAEDEPGRRVPLALVALCAWMALGVAGGVFGLVLNRQALFGIVLTGIPAFVVSLLMIGIQTSLVMGLYRLRPWAWWGCLAFYLVSCLSALVTFMRVPLAVLAGRTGAEAVSQELNREMMSWLQTYLPIFAGVVQLLFLGLILFVRRYIFPLSAPASAAVTE